MKVKIVFFDCDGVLLFGQPWKTIHRSAGVSEEQDKKWFDEYYSGKITFKKWNKNVEEKYKELELNREKFEKVLDIKNYPINPQAKELITYLKFKKIKIAIISGGIDYYVGQVANYFGIEDWSANFSFVFDENGIFTKLNSLDDDQIAKVNAVKKISESFGISHLESVFIGDSRNDVEAFEFTQRGILYNHIDPELEKLAWKKVDNLLEVVDIIKEENAKSDLRNKKL